MGRACYSIKYLNYLIFFIILISEVKKCSKTYTPELRLRQPVQPGRAEDVRSGLRASDASGVRSASAALSRTLPRGAAKIADEPRTDDAIVLHGVSPMHKKRGLLARLGRNDSGEAARNDSVMVHAHGVQAPIILRRRRLASTAGARLKGNSLSSQFDAHRAANFGRGVRVRDSIRRNYLRPAELIATELFADAWPDQRPRFLETTIP